MDFSVPRQVRHHAQSIAIPVYNESDRKVEYRTKERIIDVFHEVWKISTVVRDGVHS